MPLTVGLALMPQNNAIDWSGLKVAAISLNSVRAAADRAAANLPEDERRRFIERVNKRAYRERWLDNARALSVTAPTNAKPLSNNVQSGADSLATKLAEDSNATKNGFSTMARRVAEAAGKYTPTKALKSSRALRDVATIAGQVHGWTDKGGDDRRVMINIGILTE